MKTSSRKTGSPSAIVQRFTFALALAGVVAGTAIAASPSLSNSPSSVVQNEVGIEPALMAQHMAQRNWMTAQAPTAADLMLARADAPRSGHGPGASGLSPEERQTRMAKRFERYEARRTERLNALKADLKITTEQEAAWLAFINRTAPDTSKMKKRMVQRQDWQGLTTPERIDRMQAMHAERQAMMNKRLDAVKSFYAVLSPEQQKVFDQKGMRSVRGGKHMRMGQGKGSHHGHKGMRHGKHGHHGHYGDRCEGMNVNGRHGTDMPTSPSATEEQMPTKS